MLAPGFLPSATRGEREGVKKKVGEVREAVRVKEKLDYLNFSQID